MTFKYYDPTEFRRYISDLEDPAITFEDKLKRIRTFCNISSGEEIVEELIGLYSLDELTRRLLIRRTLGEIMNLSPKEVRVRMMRVPSTMEMAARAIEELNEYFDE